MCCAIAANADDAPMKRLFAFAAGLVAILVIGFALLRTPDTDAGEMIAKYGGADARFADGAGGLRVHWRDEGCRDCPAIILLHGSNASLHAWTPIVARLGGEYRLITYDQPGSGLTGPHPRDDYTAAGMFEALNAVANAARLDHFYLGGNSMGGFVAWRYALAYPERVDGLILIDAAGAPMRAGETPPPLNLGFRLARNPLLRPLLEQITPRRIIRKSLLETTAVDAIVDDAMVDRYWELLRFPGNRRAAAIRATTEPETGFADRLGEITDPALLLWGAEDQLIYASAATTFVERLQNAEIVLLDGVGHLPMEEAPDRTANAIRRFLEAQQPEAVDTLRLEQSQ
jgi:pimeloyl-ACP methyl ester carboxylesterase